VASDIPGYRFVAGRHARLVTPGDAVALARALARSVDDVTASAGASAPAALDSAFAHASTWSMARLAERYTGIYEAALSSRQPAG